MPKISPALRERLLQQKKGMQRGGMLIRNKDVRRLKLRLLPPPEGEVPGVQNVSFFSKTLNKGTTSPINWGVACPIDDFLGKLWNTGSKEDKEAAKLFCRRNVEYWIPVISREDEGSPQNPKLRILAAKETVYQQITDWLLDEDEDEDDITDPLEGRDVVVKKKGEGLDTKWTVEKSDRSPISEDEDMANAWVELASTFDVRSRFYPPKLDVIQQMYQGLSGEKLPDHYVGPIKELIATLEAGGHVDPDLEHGAVETEDVSEASGALTGQLVQFKNGEETLQGVVTGPDADEDGNWLVVEEDGNPDEPWSIPVGLLTVVSPPKAIVKKTVAKPAMAKAPSTKPPASMPRKPGAAVPATKPSASSAIKSSLKSRTLGKK